MKNIVALDNRITSFENGIMNNAKLIKALDSRLTSFADAIMTNADNTGSLSTRFSSVEALVNSLSEKVTMFGSDMSRLSSRVEANESAIMNTED